MKFGTAVLALTPTMLCCLTVRCAIAPGAGMVSKGCCRGKGAFFHWSCDQAQKTLFFWTHGYTEVQENMKNCVFTWANTPQVILLSLAFPKDLLCESNLKQVKNAHKMLTGYKFHKEEYILSFLCSKCPSHLLEIYGYSEYN